MRPGFELVKNKETVPSDEEQRMIRMCIRDCHTKSVGEWLINQKPKMRAKFNRFMSAVVNSPPPQEFSQASANVSERFARDIIQHVYHPVLAEVISSNSEFSDVLHILSLHMQRTNVMASIPAVRDETPKLLKAIAQEDHIYATRSTHHHETPKAAAAQALTRARMNEPLPQCPRTRSCKPDGSRSTPFAMFPTGEPLESTMHRQFVRYDYKKEDNSKVYNVLNSPTCL